MTRDRGSGAEPNMLEMLLTPGFWFFWALLGCAQSVVYLGAEWGSPRECVAGAMVGKLFSLPVAFGILSAWGNGPVAAVLIVAACALVEGALLVGLRRDHWQRSALLSLFGNALSWGIVFGMVWGLSAWFTSQEADVERRPSTIVR